MAILLNYTGVSGNGCIFIHKVFKVSDKVPYNDSCCNRNIQGMLCPELRDLNTVVN